MRKAAISIFLWVLVLISSKVTLARNRLVSPSQEPTVLPTATPTPESVNITEAYDKKSENISSPLSLAVEKGVPENTIVLLLLLPLVATLVSFLHYVVGVSGYGIFMPTMVSVAMLATGLKTGLSLFVVILGSGLLSNKLLKKVKLHFWPARTITLLMIGLTTLITMSIAASLGLLEVGKISIFPILFMIVLTEEFIRTQLAKSKKEAVRLTWGTLLLAIIGTLTMRIQVLQDFVLRYPGWVILLVVIINLVVGSYGGIRMTEIKRFKGAIRKK